MTEETKDRIFEGVSDTENLGQSEEVRRLVSHQIEQTRHYENRAERILRIFIASIGLSITGVSLLVSAADITWSDVQNYNDIISNNLDGLTQQISNLPFLNEGLAIFIILFLTICLGVMLPGSIFLLLGVGAAEAWQVIKPESPDPVALPIQKEGSIERYTSVINKNDDILQKKEKGLQKALRSGVYSILMFMTALIFTVLPVVFQNALVAVLGFLIILLWMIYESYNRFDREEVIDFLKPRVGADSSIAGQWLILAVAEVHTVSGQLENIALVALIGLASGSVAMYLMMDLWELAKYGARLAAGLVILSLAFLLFGLEAIPLKAIDGSIVMSVIIMGWVVCGFNFLTGFGASMLHATLRQIPDWLKKDIVNRKDKLAVSLNRIWDELR